MASFMKALSGSFLPVVPATLAVPHAAFTKLITGLLWPLQGALPPSTLGWKGLAFSYSCSFLNK